MTEHKSDLKPTPQRKRRLTTALSITVALVLLALAAYALLYPDRPAARPHTGAPAPEVTQTPSDDTHRVNDEQRPGVREHDEPVGGG